jgi:hypothetical protein
LNFEGSNAASVFISSGSIGVHLWWVLLDIERAPGNRDDSRAGGRSFFD